MTNQAYRGWQIFHKGKKLDSGQVWTPYICTTNQLANVLTKGLSSLAFQQMIDKLGMENTFAPTWGGALEELRLGCWPCNTISTVKYCIVVQYYVDPKILLELICFLVRFIISLFRF